MAYWHYKKIENPLGLIFQIIILIIYLIFTIAYSIVSLFLSVPMVNVKDKVVLITGTGGGLGRAMSIEFAKLGSKVACVDIQTDLNDETVKLLNKINPKCAKSYKCDIGNNKSVIELMKNVYSDFNKVDILINNAAIVAQFTILQEDISDEHLQNIFNINIVGHFRMVRAFLPDMIKNNTGHIVAISSMSSMAGVANATAYASSKWAVSGFMESLREELDLNPKNNINTTLVKPFFIKTNPEYTKFFDARIPILEVEPTAKKIVRAIMKNKSSLSIPEELDFIVTLFRLFPTNIYDYATKNIMYFHWNTPKSTKDISKNASFKILAGEMQNK